MPSTAWSPVASESTSFSAVVPVSYAMVVDDQGNYVVDSNGSYVVINSPLSYTGVTSATGSYSTPSVTNSTTWG